MSEHVHALPAGPGTPVGTRLRLRRLIEPRYGSCIIVALDHGMTSPRFLDGLVDTRSRIEEAIEGGANVLMLSRGTATWHWESLAGRASLALMLTASAADRPSGPQVTAIGSVEEALRLGADAVVVYVALAGDDEPEMIRYLSQIGESCQRLGMPLIAEAEFPNAYARRESVDDSLGVEYLRRNARLCAEMGADIVKVNWSGDQRSFASIVAACERPVVLAGGPVIDDGQLLERMAAARDAGAIGCSVGRNVFEHRHPAAMTRALSAIFRTGSSAADALENLRAEMASMATNRADGASAGKEQVR
jgi:DhnA family fructose-bisphosphate aldolase class Ia